MNKVEWLVAGTFVAVLGVSFYAWNHYKQRQGETESQVAAAQAKVLRDIAAESKKTAEASDLKVLVLTKTVEEAKKVAETEHAKTEALKKKLLAMGVQPLPGIPGGAEDTSSLKDQIITQQENEIQSLNTVIENQGEEIKTLTLSRDSWKESALKFEDALSKTDKQIRAMEIQRDALKRSGVMREAKGALEGGAVVFVLTLLKVL